MKKTIFKGIVNDKEFTCKEEMKKYIQYCIDNEIDITNTSYSTETSYCSDNCDCCKDNCESHSETTKLSVPKGYKNLVDYLVPEINEDVFTGDIDKDEDILDDTTAKLNKRLDYIVYNASKISDSQLEELENAAKAKIEFCSKRIQECNQLMEAHQDTIEKLQKENERLLSIKECYDDLGGYLSAISED